MKKKFVAVIATIIILNLSFKTQAQNNPSWTLIGNNGMGGTKQFEFGYGVAGKEPSAGKIGYQTWTPGYLEIVGAGTLGTNRKIKFYNEGGALFTGSVEINNASNPAFNLIANGSGQLQLAVATCNGCYSAFALTGNSVIRPIGVGGPNPKRIILSTGTTSGSGGAIEFNSDSHRIMFVNDNNSVTIGTLTLPALAPTGGYRLGVLGNTNINGSLVIGDPSTITSATPFASGYKLFVTDGILTEKVKVSLKTTADWADFVFAPEYKLMPLDSVAIFIEENKHLPDVPSAEEVVTNGIDLGKMDAKLLQKIEELTLYMIEVKKETLELKEENKALKAEVEALKNRE